MTRRRIHWPRDPDPTPPGWDKDAAIKAVLFVIGCVCFVVAIWLGRPS